MDKEPRIPSPSGRSRSQRTSTRSTTSDRPDYRNLRLQHCTCQSAESSGSEKLKKSVTLTSQVDTVAPRQSEEHLQPVIERAQVEAEAPGEENQITVVTPTTPQIFESTAPSTDPSSAEPFWEEANKEARLSDTLVVTLYDGSESSYKSSDVPDGEVNKLLESMALGTRLTETANYDKPQVKEDLPTNQSPAAKGKETAVKHDRSTTNIHEKQLYKLTPGVKSKLQQQNPVLSGYILDHYFTYGKPPFYNYGRVRDFKICRY